MSRNRDKLPLQDEAEAREKWRGGDTILKKGGGGAGLPASEVDDAAAPESRNADGRPGGGGPGTLLPPD